MTSPETIAGWQLDQAGARAYERQLVPRFFDPFAADILEDLDLQPGQHLLDVACGTGIVSRHAARQLGPAGQVTAVDISPAMLAVARQVTSTATAAPISFQHADVIDLPLPDDSADVVVCQQGLQFFPDQPAALSEMLRVLAPGGRLAVSTCCDLEHQTGYRALVEVLTRHVGVQAAQVTASPFALGDPDRLQRLVADAGSAEATVDTRSYRIRFDSPGEFLVAETSSSPLGLVVDRLDDDVREALVEDLASALASYSDDDGLAFPFLTLTATTS